MGSLVVEPYLACIKALGSIPSTAKLITKLSKIIHNLTSWRLLFDVFPYTHQIYFWSFTDITHDVYTTFWERKEHIKIHRGILLCARISLCHIFLSLAKEAAMTMCELASGSWFWDGGGRVSKNNSGLLQWNSRPFLQHTFHSLSSFLPKYNGSLKMLSSETRCHVSWKLITSITL